MTQTPVTPPDRRLATARRRWPRGLIVMLLVSCALETILTAQSTGSAPKGRTIPVSQMFTFLFLMLGPFKILGPYAAMTRNADAGLARRLALHATFYATLAVLLAAVVGQGILDRYSIPIPVLALAAGLILFLVALQTILQQFAPPQASAAAPTPTPTMSMAMTPLAFPTIVTPYGIAAIIVFIALSPDLAGQLTVGALVMGIMAINLGAMLAARGILRMGGVLLQILGSVLGIIQVALGLQIILSSLKTIWG